MKLKVNITIKLIGYLVVVSILPLSAFALISYEQVRDTLISQARGYSVQLLNNQSEYLQLQMEQVENLAGRIASTEEISAVAIKADAMDAEHNAYDDLSTQAEIRQNLNAYSNLKGIVSIDLFTVKGHRFYVGDTLTVPGVEEARRRQYYEAGLASPLPVLWLGVEDNLNSASPNHKVLTALKIIRRYSEEKRASEPVGMLLINYSTESLADHFGKVDFGQNSFMLVADARGRLIYSPDRRQIGSPMPAQIAALTRQGIGSERVSLDQNDVFVSFTCLPQTGWCSFGVIPEKTLLAPMRRLTQTALLLMTICFAIIVLAGRLFRRGIVKPIQAISDGFRKIQANQSESVSPLPLPANKDEIGELVAWFNAFLDALHLRDQYEQKLRDSEYKFSGIFQLSPMPLGLVRIENGEFVDVNDSWLLQFGFEREDVIGRTSFELKVWNDETDRERMMDQVRRTGVVLHFEAKHRKKDGTVLDIVMSGRPFDFMEERLFIFTPVDVTRQRQIEQEIRDMNLQLESRVRSRTLKLELANSELAEAMESLKRTKGELVRSEKMAALGSLVAGIAHELNTPIGNSVTVASTLQDQTIEVQKAMETGGIRRSAILDYLDTIAKGSELLMRNLGTARELVAGFKQVAADQASNQRRQFNLKETVEGILVTLVPMYKKTAFTMQCELQEGILMDSYPGPLGQILTNFVTNALAHAFDGRADGNMHLRCRKLDEARVEITFSDDGNGIPSENLKRVFDPFFTTKLGQGGSGLGLNIVYNIVTSVLGGSIELESTIGKGTNFIVVLPLEAPYLTPGNV